MTTVEVISPGALTTIQDLGRPGWAHIGVPRSGAADRESLKLANQLVGNDHGAAALETTLTGPTLHAGGDTVVALTGAPVGNVPMNTPIELRADEVLKLGAARRGLRTYIAFRGGIDVPLVLGSAAADVLTGLGPAPLARGDVLRIGAATGGRAIGAPARVPPPPDDVPQEPTLHTILGPRDDWFTSEALERLTTAQFTVTPSSNRVGLRLEGPKLDRTRAGELPSEGLVAGAIQVPPSGQPIMLLADHPTTGGYPVIAVVHSADLALAGQLRPGQRLRFAAAIAGGLLS
jgi:biotin-dependent carboxylase-like uncharacterized protein